MPQPDDELAALHAINPIDETSLPSPRSAQAQAMFERIIMTTETTSEPTTSETTIEPATAGATRSANGRRILAAVAAAAAIAAVGGSIAALRTSDTGTNTASPATTVASGGITPGGSIGSCVETYSLATLGNRAYAFDGTVARVDGDEVEFKVNEAFHGVDAQRITLKGASTLGGATSAGEAMSLSPGSRLLVAGDGGFAWSCGFTQPYSADTATQWRGAFPG